VHRATRAARALPASAHGTSRCRRRATVRGAARRARPGTRAALHDEPCRSAPRSLLGSGVPHGTPPLLGREVPRRARLLVATSSSSVSRRGQRSRCARRSCTRRERCMARDVVRASSVARHDEECRSALRIRRSRATRKRRKGSSRKVRRPQGSCGGARRVHQRAHARARRAASFVSRVPVPANNGELWQACTRGVPHRAPAATDRAHPRLASQLNHAR